MTFLHRSSRAVLVAGVLLVGLAAISPVLGADVGVSIAGKRFDPADIVVPQGATVTWTVTQGIGEPHTVTSKKVGDGKQGALFDSQTSDPNLTSLKANGGTFSFTFKDVGTFSYLCAVHPEMTGTVLVLAPGQSPPPATSGGGEAGSPDRKLIAAGILLVSLVVLFGAAMVWRRMNPA